LINNTFAFIFAKTQKLILCYGREELPCNPTVWKKIELRTKTMIHGDRRKENHLKLSILQRINKENLLSCDTLF
jgi:hypothetical protein